MNAKRMPRLYFHGGSLQGRSALWCSCVRDHGTVQRGGPDGGESLIDADAIADWHHLWPERSLDVRASDPPM